MFKNKRKGFSLVEIVVVIAIMLVLLAILTPSLLAYVEQSRMRKDESAMDEVVNAVQLALADGDTFDEALAYSVPNNFMTYTDSSGIYGQKIADEEFWAPDGSGDGVTITFNPDENGNYDIAKGIVNDMTYDNGSVAESRVAEGDLKQCWFEEMGTQHLLYASTKQVIGNTVSEKSATYKNSSFTIFINFNIVDTTATADVSGSFNGTNLFEGCQAAVGSGTSSYDENKAPITTKPGGTTTAQFTSSDLSGGGTVTVRPSYKPCPHDEWVPSSTDATKKHTCTECGIEKEHEFPETGHTAKCTVCNYIKEHTCEYGDDNICIHCGEKIIEYWFTTWDYDNKMGTTTATDTHVDIPETFTYNGQKYKVVAINSWAFESCRNLTSVTIPDSVTQIRNLAFCKCSSLTSVTIPSSVTGMSFNVFDSCTSLTSIGPVGSGADLEIPNSITGISERTFAWCTNLTSVTIPDSVTWIGHEAFESCDGLTNITLPKSITYIGVGAFRSCDDLRSITYKGTKSEWKAIDIGTDWKEHSYKLRNVYCTDGCLSTDGGNACYGGTATCTQKAICSKCGNEYGDFAPHTGGTATCTQKAICSRCGNEYGDFAPHTGGTATPTQKAVCTVCGSEYGDLLISKTIETAHNYTNGMNYEVVGTWNYPGATSVNITIEYQTEVGSKIWDWVSITEGTDYVSGSSYNSTRNYLNTSGSIVSATGTNSSVKFGGSTKTTKTFENVNMASGTVVFRSDSGSTYWGAKVTVTPNY